MGALLILKVCQGLNLCRVSPTGTLLLLQSPYISKAVPLTRFPKIFINLGYISQSSLQNFWYTTMNDPTMPERALLTLRRAEEAELNDCPDNLEHQPNIHRIRNLFPFSELKISYLPITTARGIRLSRIRDNIPLHYLGWAPQRSL